MKSKWTMGLYASGALLAAVTQPLQVSADEGGNPWSVKWQYRFRVEGNEKTDFTSNRDFMLLRIRPEVRYSTDPSLSVTLAPQFARTFGEPIWTASPPTGTTSVQASSGGTVDPSFNVHEAYLTYQAAPWLTLKPGRQVISYGDELVLGALEWNNTGRSFDAVRSRATLQLAEGGWSDLFFAKLSDNNTVGSGAGDTDLYGLYNSIDFGEGVHAFDLYALYRRAASVSPVSDVGAAGVRMASKAGLADYRVEATREFGSAVTSVTEAYQLDAEAGWTFQNADARPRLGFEYFRAGRTYDQLYPTTHKWLGYADVLGRRNVTGFVVHGSFQPMTDVTAKVDYHRFARTSLDGAVFRTNGTTALGSASGSGDSTVGSEWDLTLAYQLSKPAVLSLGVSLFQPGAFLKDQLGDLSPRFFYGQIEVRL